MKTIITILSLFLTAIMVITMTTTLCAYEKPDTGVNYMDFEGGADPTEMHFSNLVGGSAYRVVDAIFGEGTYSRIEGERADEVAEKIGFDRSDPNYSPHDRELIVQFNAEMFKYIKIEPMLYMIETLGITKEQFVKANATLDERDRYTDEEIDLYYSGDLHALLEYMKAPLAYVYGDEIFSFNEVMQLDFKKQYEMYTKGDFGEYLERMKNNVMIRTYENVDSYYSVDEREYDWMMYTIYMLEESGKAPATGSGVFALAAAASVSGAVVFMIGKRRIARKASY